MEKDFYVNTPIGRIRLYTTEYTKAFKFKNILVYSC